MQMWVVPHGRNLDVSGKVELQIPLLQMEAKTFEVEAFHRFLMKLQLSKDSADEVGLGGVLKVHHHLHLHPQHAWTFLLSSCLGFYWDSTTLLRRVVGPLKVILKVAACEMTSEVE